MASKMEGLREQWNAVYRERLPALAKQKDAVQQRWPVYLDHCFARIVLDNAIGKDRPWTDVVKQPAVKNMTEEQLELAIDLAGKIVSGEANLDHLNNRSLELRGKKRKAKDDDVSIDKSGGKKQRRVDGDVSSYFRPSDQSPRKPTDKAKTSNGEDDAPITQNEDNIDNDDPVDMKAQIQRIKDSNITAFRKQALTLLCQIPRGRYSTYQALSDYITRSSHKTCARAVGNAMRNNPFAPEVPCHRVLANDGSLGGFCGSWGEGGKFAGEKHRLLHEEGVRFDSRGKVKGRPFRGFTA